MKDEAIDHEEFGGAKLGLQQNIVLLPVDGGVLIDGGGKLQFWREIISETVAPLLFPKLDGTRSFREIVAEFPLIDKAYIREAIDGMASFGLLKDGSVISRLQKAGSQYASETEREILTETLDNERVDQRRIAEAAVRIVMQSECDRWFGDALSEQLLESGIEEVSIGTEKVWTGGASHLSNIQISNRLPNASPRAQCSVFVGRPDVSHEFQVGPLVDHSTSRCLTCYKEAFEKFTGDEGLTFAQRQLLVSFVTWEIIDVLLHRSNALQPNRVRRYDLAKGTYKTEYLCCRRALTADFIEGPCGTTTLSPSIIYNERVSEEFANNGGLGKISPWVLGGYGKVEFSAASRFHLPRNSCDLSVPTMRVLSRGGSGLKKPFKIDGLAALLSFGAGIKEVVGTRVKRWAPSGGNMGSVRIHVNNTCFGELPEGLYSYEAMDHELVARRTRNSLSASQLHKEVSGGASSKGTFLIVLSARRDLLFDKYQEFSYKLSNLDAGAAIAQITLILGAFGWFWRIYDCWPDDLLGNELNLRTDREHISAVIEVHRSKTHILFPRRRLYGSAQIEFSGGHLGSEAISDLTNTLQEASKFRNVGDCASTRNVEVSIDDWNTKGLKLPSRATSRLSVAGTLEKRTSIRAFDESEIRMEELHSILYAAWFSDYEEWKGVHRKVPLSFIVLKRDGRTKVRAAFRYEPYRQLIVPLSEGLNEDCGSEIFFQSEFASAPLSILITANLSRACRNLGTAAYRLLLLRAGAAGHRMWLAGVAFGLEGTVHAGIKISSIRRHLFGSLDGQAPLFACSLGARIPRSAIPEGNP